ncbi:hypothetical protein UAW_03055 [Enterococcus haemoperoxidus ATCC BAA-382]|uniref:Uncharacterized protein n=1 Tax=Enterococcus haemoperoxidus ATCC BAA-382 TaxID=1158608 RepID=R2SA52_9ENTE|nr:hypothetical protein [Enterococcus haemoperoxidus]EOH92390.1 hypothetical protein UAW_03055 [Enterococcus haemoperoxidus ATCC BAA-382]EOT61756.1 hypothetical protein I583_00738 [Enterococcus haemoperoxidus ATCC BAA-382]
MLVKDEKERKEREKAFRKESQRLAIKGLGKSTNEQKSKDKESIKTKGETELKDAAAMIGTTGSSFQESVKGQFGKKVTEVFEQQKQTMDHF